MTGRTRLRSPLIKRSSLHDHVVDALREMIVSGALEPGARIIEKDLSDQLGVSRTPIREALKTLVLDGLVDSPVHRGARVRPLDEAEIAALFDVISVIEALAAERVARDATDRDIGKLETRHARLRRHFEAGDREAYFAENTEIHDWIVAHAGNEVLAETHDRLMLRARRGRYLAIQSRERWDEAMQEHEALMEALRARDPQAAFRIWHQHLTHTGDSLLAAIRALEQTRRQGAATG